MTAPVTMFSLDEQKSRGFFDEYRQVVLRKPNADAVTFRNVEGMLQWLSACPLARDDYEAAAYVYIYDQTRLLPPKWPDGMQSLDVRFSHFRDSDVPPLPHGVRSVSFVKCPWLRHFDVPRVCAVCPDLEELVLYGSGIRSLHAAEHESNGSSDDECRATVPRPTPRPSELRVLDVSACPVHSIDVSRLPPSLAMLYVHDNCREDTIGTLAVAPFDSRSRPELVVHQHDSHFGHANWREEMTLLSRMYHHGGNPTSVETGSLTRPATLPVTQFRGVWEGAHNVHLRSVQDSTSASMDVLNAAYASALKRVPEVLRVSEREWVQEGMWVGNCRDALALRFQTDEDDKSKRMSIFSLSCVWLFLSRFARSCRGFSHARHVDCLLSHYLDDVCTHSTHALTITELLKRVWTVIATHPTSREDMIAVLVDELETGRRWCFTGRFTRVVNTLSGFLPGVEIGILPTEQLSNRLAVLWKKVNDYTAAPSSSLSSSSSTVAFASDQPGPGMSRTPSNAENEPPKETRENALALQAEALFREACRAVLDAQQSNPVDYFAYFALWLGPFVDALFENDTSAADYAMRVFDAEREEWTRSKDGPRQMDPRSTTPQVGSTSQADASL